MARKRGEGAAKRRSAAEADDKSRIQTYQKMMDVLESFSSIDRQLSLAQIAESAGLPRPTAHRILGALREIGFIEQDSRRGTYALGIRLLELGSLALSNMDLHREAKPFIEKLARLSEQSVHLGVFNGREIVVVEREDYTDRSQLSLNRTEVAPAYCTGLGKAILAFQDRAVVEKVVRAGLKPFTRNTITAPAALQSELARVRKQGYAVDNAEHEMWVRCVAAPIRNARGETFAAISVTGAADRMTEDRVSALSAPVVQAADSISLHLGWSGAAD